MLRNYFQCQTIRDSKFLNAIGFKRLTNLSIIKHKVNSSDKSTLIQVKQIWKYLTNPFNFSDFDRCSIVIECGGIASFSHGLVAFWKYLYLMESSWIHCFHMWLSKFLFIKMSKTNWYQVDFNFTALPLLAWIEVIIRATNSFLGFILTIGFGDEYNFRCEDPFIVLSNVS